jgi:hypothetical protein
MDTLKQKCLQGGEIVLTSNPHYYDMCKAQYECIPAD